MFAIEKHQQNGFDKVFLTHHTTGTTVAVVPGCGAMLHAFIVQDGDKSINIIDSYTGKEEFDEKAEANGFKGLKLSPFPCRIPNGTYRFNGRQYQLNHSLQHGSAIHGLLYKQPFRLVQEQVLGNSAHVSLLHEYKGDDAGYPFSYNCIVEYHLEENNTLSITTTIKNTGISALPIADGWHPYFTFGGKVNDLELQFCSREVLEFIDLIPTGKILPYTTFTSPARIGETALDNSFVLDFSKAQPMCILRDPATGWQLEIRPDNSYPYLQIYIPPHRNSIAIENLSAPPDSFNNGIGLITLAAGASARFSTQYAIRKV
ncbi:MAG TPA: aldose 1-epimerase [Agriterribacter sp.]|uniref:aldose 1-epimerase n=1 Tax=Agriterribacter sp. TaxID=2821509 RepID=UPI002CE8BB78|nr:aldose 1-epimerase [Agriterribacter sp.]HRQ18221.1 aldose 1-epimerase [Agriterribacter sp.]